jgi:hypothetical protein
VVAELVDSALAHVAPGLVDAVNMRQDCGNAARRKRPPRLDQSVFLYNLQQSRGRV